jgi:hypothetical protein
VTRFGTLIVAVTATVLVAAPAAFAKSERLPTGGGGGHATVTNKPRGEGGPVVVRACGDDPDGFRVVAWACERAVMVAHVQDANGAGSGCGRAKRLVGSGKVRVQVCSYDQSARGQLDLDDPREARKPQPWRVQVRDVSGLSPARRECSAE